MLVRSLLTLTAMACCVNVAAADATAYRLTGENTKVEFVGKKVGKKKEGSHTGGFKKLSGTATIKNLNDPQTLSLSATIETGSIYSDNSGLTSHLKGPDFFDIKKFPKAKFVSEKVIKTKSGYVIEGKLTLHGKSAKVRLPAKIATSEGTLKVTSSFEIDRTEFGMSYGQGSIEENVAIALAIEVKKQADSKDAPAK